MNQYVVIGAGGTGTMLLPPLYTYLRSLHKDNFLLHIVDGDVVEEKNLARQAFAPAHVGQNKAVAAQAMLADDIRVIAHPEYVSEENVGRFVSEDDTVLICVDNFTVRKRIEDHARTLDAVTVINGGNEATDGSVQLWVREAGHDVTPRLSYLHPEIAVAVGTDRAEMTCAQAAALPGGEQTVIANLQSATWMLTALWRKHQNRHYMVENEPRESTWTELQFDSLNGSVQHIDQRMSRFWSEP